MLGDLLVVNSATYADGEQAGAYANIRSLPGGSVVLTVRTKPIDSTVATLHSVTLMFAYICTSHAHTVHALEQINTLSIQFVQTHSFHNDGPDRYSRIFIE